MSKELPVSDNFESKEARWPNPRYLKECIRYSCFSAGVMLVGDGVLGTQNVKRVPCCMENLTILKTM
jgi:hypothetical protein